MYWYQREAFLDQQLEGTDFVPRDRKGGWGVKERETESDRERERESHPIRLGVCRHSQRESKGGG